jgi:S-formylglutathione hydrolase FrmB
VIRLRTDFFAESLGMNTSMVVLLPQDAAGIGMQGADGTGADAAEADRGFPVLYLLHGLSDDCTIWERWTSIERHASEKGIAVVMPEVRRSFYCDEVFGENYWTLVSEELPAMLARSFRISTAREDTFVAGLSMGGFGAFKLALNHPDRFAAAASFSGATDLRPRAELFGSEWSAEQHRIWGEEPTLPTVDDLIGLLEQSDPTSLPPLFLDCGTEDALMPLNETFIRVAEERSVDLTSRLRPGDHTWDFWDRSVQDFLDWIPLRGA